MTHYDIVIVGAGHAGAQAAISLRQLGFAESIAMVGDEIYPPYERPPLSKEYLAGDKSFDRILIRPLAFWAERQVELLLGKRVDAIDATAKQVVIGQESIGYDRLIWCTGGSPRKLTCDGATAPNVHAVRRRDDVDAMIARLAAVNHVTIVGGGYIGLEAAAVLTKLGKKVVLLEAFDRVLARVAGEELSRFYETEHRAHGVDLRTGAKMDGIDIEGGLATGVRLADGERIATDMIVVGIGIVPETGPLIAAGAKGDNGVEVDEYCRTSLPYVYAVGDCALHANRFCKGARIRVESVQNANDQAKTAAAHIMGKEEPYQAVPWFWSNQYDLKLQTVGMSSGFDKAVLRGDPSTRAFSVVYLRNGKVIALDCVNAVKDYVQGRALVVDQAGIDPTLLADSTIALKDIRAIDLIQRHRA